LVTAKLSNLTNDAIIIRAIKNPIPKQKNGTRFELKIKTTPVREGYETALMIQDALKSIGIKLLLDITETSTFISSIKQKKYQLYVSRWVGVSDASIFYTVLKTNEPNNRNAYSNATVDELLNLAFKQNDLQKRADLFKKIQMIALDELPYFPLFFWNNTLITSKRVAPVSPEQISKSGGYSTLSELKLKP
jgi:ABC-type transport system substrate-binding protein